MASTSVLSQAIAAPWPTTTAEEAGTREDKVGAEGRLRESSQDAFADFYAETFPEVYAYLARRAGGVPLAEELTQETYLAAVAALKRGRGSTLSLPWLIGVARHKLIDHFRKEERESRKLSLVAREPAISEAQEDDESGERARAALAKVAGMQRAALVLRYLDNLSVPEVAEALGKSVHATESLLARGRESFKRNYREVPNE